MEYNSNSGVKYNLPSGGPKPKPKQNPKPKPKSARLLASSFTPIMNPDAAYQSSTQNVDFSGLPFGAQITFVADGIQTVTFSSAMNKVGPVPNGWATWSSPPFSESANPFVLTSNDATVLTWTLTRPSVIFGFELEPDPFAVIHFNVDFFSGATLIGSVTRDVNGEGGARLFAAQTNGSFDRVVITGESGFAVAQIRYALRGPK
ncbi:hypothetical protein FE783_17170 [Paenibacillus mesophilus]|uniref:hypothetical protein n=1 Tax=Paenibacillus mesophilus TaxID=2582849 RepID=UPI00110D3347|nr:hypothetical protein [Paenibacillus mesophilus]TMV48775.1 hypothetical protein FE783_17170 [Paenibacillus mesophilus]